MQLFGSDPEIMSAMAARIEDGPYDLIDVNMGCPVPKVVNNGEGSALMKTPKLVEEIFTAMVKRLKKPVTVKIRKGFQRRYGQRRGDRKDCGELRSGGGGGPTAAPGSSTTRERRTGRSSAR